MEKILIKKNKTSGKERRNKFENFKSTKKKKEEEREIHKNSERTNKKISGRDVG